MTEITPARMQQLAIWASDIGQEHHHGTAVEDQLNEIAAALRAAADQQGRDAATLAARDALLAKAERFRVDEDTAIETRGDDTWAIVRRGAVLNRDGEWEHEPMPSHRSDEFIARTRYSLGEALGRALAAEIAAALGAGIPPNTDDQEKDNG